jgi:hypothetical protein
MVPVLAGLLSGAYASGASVVKINCLRTASNYTVGQNTTWYFSTNPVDMRWYGSFTSARVEFTCHPTDGSEPYICETLDVDVDNSGNANGMFATTIAGNVTAVVVPTSATDVLDPSASVHCQTFLADVPTSYTVSPETIDATAGMETTIAFAAFDEHGNNAEATNGVTLSLLMVSPDDSSFSYIPISGVRSSVADYNTSGFRYTFYTSGQLTITSTLAGARTLVFGMEYCDVDCTDLGTKDISVIHMPASPSRYSIVGPNDGTVDDSFESTFHLVDEFNNVVSENATIILTIADEESVTHAILNMEIVDGIGTTSFTLTIPADAYTMNINQGNSQACGLDCLLQVDGSVTSTFPIFKVEAGVTVKYVIIDPDDGSPTDPTAPGSVDTDVAVRIEARDQYANIAVSETRDITLVVSGSAKYKLGAGNARIANGFATVVITDSVAEVVTLTLNDADNILPEEIDLTDSQNVRIFLGKGHQVLYYNPW